MDVERLSTGINGLDTKMQGGFLRNSVNLVTGRTGTGKCIAPHTPILLSSGNIVTAEDLFNMYFHQKNNSDEIFLPVADLELFSVNPETLKMERKKASHIYRQRIKEKMVKLITSSNRVLETTKAHRFLSLENGKIAYKKASELKRGDYVAVPRLIKITPNRLKNREWMKNLAKFLAFQIAEGDEWTGKNYYLRFHNKDQSKLDDYCMLARKLFNYSPKIRQQKNKTPHVRIFSKKSIEYLKSFGFEPCRKSRDKKIPEIILTSDDDTVSIFLRTFYDCEGTVSNKQTEIDLVTASRDIANKVSYMLLRFGLVARIREVYKAATNGTKIKRKYYIVRISGIDNMERFGKQIGFDDEEKASRVSFHLNKIANTNVDIVPEIGSLLRDTRNDFNIPATEMGDIGGKDSVYMYEWENRSPSRPMLENFIKTFKGHANYNNLLETSNMKLLENLADSHIFWDKVKIIEEFKPDYEYVYDFTVEDNHNFVSGFGGIMTHNTALCISFLYQGAKAGEPGVYITTEEREQDVKDDIKAMFGWDLEALERKKLLRFLSIKPVLPARTITPDKLAQLIKLYVFNISDKIQKAVKGAKAKRVVVDSVSMIEMFIKDEYFAKAALMQFVETLKTLNVTSILTGTVSETSEALSGKGIIEYIVDSIIKLNFIPVTEEFKRTLLVRKMRRTDHSTLVHPFEITKNGLKIIDIKKI